MPGAKAPILCFVGPPGVGKTTLAKSIADATGRKYVRISLGGVNYEPAIRGDRRSFIGSKPGSIIQALKSAGTLNPVILLDEIDKIGRGGLNGDPTAALLEVLDPAQNNSFKDHYIEIGVDLSKVMFIATANSLNIPPALLDRMEIVEVPGYTPQEKIVIAKRHIIPKQLKENGLKAGEFSITDDAIAKLIHNYTRESGIRELDRLIGTLCRKAIREIDKGEANSVVITSASLEKYLDRARVIERKALTVNTIGKTQGLYAGIVGGTAAIEVSILPGKGRIYRTGNLGKVLQESILAALTVVKSMLPDYGIDPQILEKRDIHIHSPDVPRGEGPSGGITIATSILSAITKIPVNKDVCMTGQINLQGDVMRIGGLRDKLIAAHSAGLKIAIIPEDNNPDLDDVPQQVKDEMQIIPVKNISEVFKIALVITPEGK
jgi:ATP-dependent Lon protease